MGPVGMCPEDTETTFEPLNTFLSSQWKMYKDTTSREIVLNSVGISAVVRH
jgi:hypothetical protein